MDEHLLKSELTCPVCFTIPKSKIYLGVNGHKVCEHCYDKLKPKDPANGKKKQCPISSCDYDYPPRRNRDLENIIDKSGFEVNCAYAGCGVELTKHELANHEPKCPYRLVTCPDIWCNKMVRFRVIEKCAKCMQLSSRQICYYN